MSHEGELERRLAERANGVDLEPNLAWVESEASRRQRRRLRYPAAAGALAVLAGGVLAVAAVADRPADDHGGSAGEIPETNAAAEPTGSTSPGSRTAASSADSRPRTPAISGDAAAPFLESTVEVYRRDMGDREIVVRRSERSWAEHFDLAWRAPTGTADLCMADHVLFVGDPAVAGPPGSTVWSPIQEFEDFDGDVAVDQGWSGVSVVRSSGPADEVLLLADGNERDRATLDDGLAVLDTSDLWQSSVEFEPSLVLVTDGVPGDALPFGSPYGRATEQFQQECTPGPPPVRPLPPAGEQPTDSVAAEARILEVYTEARDRTVPLPLEDPPSVDDITGIEDAAAEVDAGEMAEVAATAEHTVDELVFTTPEEAWFRYTISTTAGEFGGRYGIARFDGSDWQITRATICQDLALAGGECKPEAVRIEPPEPENWDDVMADYERSTEQYWSWWDCLPEPFGPGQSACDEISRIPGDDRQYEPETTTNSAVIATTAP